MESNKISDFLLWQLQNKLSPLFFINKSWNRIQKINLLYIQHSKRTKGHNLFPLKFSPNVGSLPWFLNIDCINGWCGYAVNAVKNVLVELPALALHQINHSDEGHIIYGIQHIYTTPFIDTVDDPLLCHCRPIPVLTGTSIPLYLDFCHPTEPSEALLCSW